MNNNQFILEQLKVRTELVLNLAKEGFNTSDIKQILETIPFYVPKEENE